MKSNYRKFALLFFVVGVSLRVLLYWVNPPDNAFDNHFDPIFLIMKNGAIPAKNACWQCYHPPVFYWVSAMIGLMMVKIGVTVQHLLKILQFIPCLYGIITLAMIYLILNKLPLTDFSRLISFIIACFLPRHIYMSAINSNDTISYLFVALSIYFLLLTIERDLPILINIITSIFISIAIFTKYTSFVLFPIVVISFAYIFYKNLIHSRKKVISAFILILFLPATLLATYMTSNIKNYGSPLPWNEEQMDQILVPAHDQSPLDFLSFTPWESIKTPVISPGKMHHFWTLIYSGMWFDNEPKFLYFLDKNQDWWMHYYAWLRGETRFPGTNPSMSLLTKITGSGLITFGLFPLLLIIIGCYNYLRGRWKTVGNVQSSDMAAMIMFPTLLLSNITGIIFLVLRLPIYSSMKASYFLNSMPAFAVFLCLGIEPYEKYKIMKWVTGVIVGIIVVLVTLHILQIFLSLS
jgi:4-amino-4-deoxy-L-arabinose transferase-like glycosyltransferase